MPATSLAERLPTPVVRAVTLARRRSAMLMFAAGFLFDVLTIGRIDAWADLAFQLLYLCALTGLLLLQHREAQGHWRPPARLARWWSYNVEALHFLYGGLLSAYVVLYFRSSTGARPVVFFGMLVGLMLVNELPQVRRQGYRWRLGLYAFCVVSFLNYFVPIVLGRMATWVFALGLLLSAGLVWLVADRLAARDAERGAARRRLFAPAVVVCLAIGALYALRLIPPVPLSIQFHGIYHGVQREGAAYVLTYERPPLWRFWRRESRPFMRREGDRVHYFVRIFAPAGFVHDVVVRWEVQDPSGDWRTSDRIPMRISGGREQGFRGSAAKSNFEPGRWRVTTETEDGRAIGTLSFEVADDARERERVWGRRIE